MSDTAIIIDKYAKAAFNIAKKAKLSKVFVKDIDVFYQNILPFLKELSNPTISKIQLENIVSDLVKKLKINSTVSHFLISLTRSRRLNLTKEIHNKLEDLVKKDNKILKVELISAQKLKKAELDETKKLLQKQHPKNEIEIHEIIKKDILGGVVIKIGSHVIDNSIKNQLSTIYADCRSAI